MKYSIFFLAFYALSAGSCSSEPPEDLDNVVELPDENQGGGSKSGKVISMAKPPTIDPISNFDTPVKCACECPKIAVLAQNSPITQAQLGPEAPLKLPPFSPVVEAPKVLSLPTPIISPSQLYVCPPVLKIRSGPGVDYPTVGHLIFNEKVFKKAEEGIWTKIDEGKWVGSRYLSLHKNVEFGVKGYCVQYP